MDFTEAAETHRVTVEDMADARERRVRTQNRLLSSFRRPLICITLNIAGPVKTFPLAGLSFDEGKRQVTRQLERHGIAVLACEETREKTGFEAFIAVDAPPAFVKRLTVAVEEGDPLGRLFDIDVLDAQGRRISRGELGFPERKCLLCDAPAPVCASTRAHSLDELTRHTLSLMRTFFHTRYADKIARLAVRAMLYEVTAAPKPGLVDRENSGSHRDMDIFTFLDSSAALAAHFRDFTLKGLAFEGTAEQLFDAIRYTGLLAEDSMFAATNGANTHKGLIFSLGVLCAALGYLRGRDMPGETDRLFSLCAQMTAKLKDDFAGVTAENARTAGEKIYARYGVTGIRGEAASGFASVRAYGLPPFRALTSQGYSLNDAGVITLLHLMANAQDTNIIARSDLETQKEVQREARDLLSRTGRSPRALLQEIRGLDKSFIGRNISPGGSADLLAVTYFIYFLENDA